MVKSYMWSGGWVAHVIIVTAPVPWFGDLGIWGLGTGLVNIEKLYYRHLTIKLRLEKDAQTSKSFANKL